MRRAVFVCAIALVAWSAWGCERRGSSSESSGGGAGALPGVGKPIASAPPAKTFSITTPSWLPGQRIPVPYTCDGDDVSPEVRWSDPPEGTKSFLLIVDDPDAPGGTFTHWIAFDVRAPSTHVPEGGSAQKDIMTQGRNDFGHAKWNGPCPPKGKGEHRYFFRLFALDVKRLNLEDGATRGQVEKAVDGHVLAKIETMGTYARP